MAGTGLTDGQTGGWEDRWMGQKYYILLNFDLRGTMDRC